MQMDSSSSDEGESTRQYAIVIANSKYDPDAFNVSEAGKNLNVSPSFDARQMLRKLGLRHYEVKDYYEQSGEALKKAFSDFVAAFHKRQLKTSAEKEVWLLLSSAWYVDTVRQARWHFTIFNFCLNEHSCLNLNGKSKSAVKLMVTSYRI
jgi:hypothetical protein